MSSCGITPLCALMLCSATKLMNEPQGIIMDTLLLEKAKHILLLSGIKIKERQWKEIEITDFGLANFEQIGLFIHTYINSERCCAKELILLPRQTCPEHRHPPAESYIGKEETFCCRYGTVSLFVPGEKSHNPRVSTPNTGHQFYTVWNEKILQAGDLYTLQPNTLHWFKAHAEGAVISEFSTHSDDASDIFTDPNINRAIRVLQT